MKTINHSDPLSVAIFFFGVALLSMLALTILNAQTAICDFGSAVGVHSSGESTTFLPPPLIGTSRIRIGTQGGSAALQNPGHTLLGNASELVLVAPTGSSLNKFSMFDIPGGGTATLKFNCVLSGGAGEWYLFIGDGATYAGNTAFSSTQVLTGLRFLVDSSGTVSTAVRTASGWTSLNAAVTRDNVLRFDIYCNNTAQSEAYDFNGPANVAARCVDIWFNNALVGDNLPKSALPDSLLMDSFMFYGASSPANASTVRIDDIVWTPGIALHPLPVELLSFTALRRESSVELAWETATEINSYGFVVQRKVTCDTCGWRDLALVAGAGNSSSPRRYTWVDADAGFDLGYQYRLHLLDRDGSEEFGPVVLVEAGEQPSGFRILPAYPNPAQAITTFSFHLSSPARVRLLLFSSSGSRMFEMPLPCILPAGRHDLPYRCADLPRGRYYCIIDADGVSGISSILLL